MATEDAQVLYEAYAGDPRVTKYLTWKTNRSVVEVRAFLEGATSRIQAGREVAWILEVIETTAVIGMISGRITGHGLELGYVLAYSEWGKGLMSEAVAAVVRAAQRQDDLYRVWAFHDVDNPASGRVLEKAGLSHEARLHRWVVHPNVSPEPRDVEVYAWTR